MSPVSCDVPQQSFHSRADRDTCNNVRCPVRQQCYARCYQRCSDAPGKIAQPRRQLAGGGGQRSDVNGMTGRERVERFAGNWDAIEMPNHGQSVGPLLIEN
jgi:hypothetical protein